MRVIPVLDLKQRIVVRAVGGQRSQYGPLTSPLVDSPAPGHVARRFAQLGFGECYVADLDAIAGAEPDWNSLAEILESGSRIWLDAGPRTVAALHHLAAFRHGEKAVARVIVGLESVEWPEQLRALFEVLGPERAIFSLDLFDGAPWTRAAGWEGLSPHAILDVAIETGFRQLLLLDVHRVGRRAGPTSLQIPERWRRERPELEWYVGGGVRDLADLKSLDAAGFSAALVATALHEGRLPINNGDPSMGS